MRVHLACRRMSLREADILEYYLKNVPGVTAVKVFDRTQDAIITYQADRTALIRALAVFSFTSEQAVALVPEHTSRQLNREYEDKLVFTVCRRAFSRLFLPYPITTAIALFRSVKYIKEGLKALWHGKLSVAVLDATAVTVSMLRGDFNTAGSVMFMLRLGEILEEWTHKKSVADLAGAMALNVDKVWLQSGETELLVPIGDVRPGDRMIVRTGNLIPLDGKVVSGEAMVNQASMTGESMPVEVAEGSEVISGSVNLNGVLKIRANSAYEQSTVARILSLVESAAEKKANAERLITKFAKYYTPSVVIAAVLLAAVPPLAFHQPFMDWLPRALTFLVISCPCALVISVPLTFFGGIGGAGKRGILVKGSNYMETLSRCGTVLFDKTGTLTHGRFSIKAIYAEPDASEETLLTYTAAAESFSTHPLAACIMSAAEEMKLPKAAEVEEIAGHGVKAVVDGRTVCAGNLKLMHKIGAKPVERDASGTVIYTAVDGKYMGCIEIADTPKEGAKKAVEELNNDLGIRTVMLTGDRKAAAKNIADTLGIAEFHAELLPQNKVEIVEQELAKENGKRSVAFVGDGINDAPVIARADVGLAMGGLGSDAAIEAADIVIMDDRIEKVPLAVRIARRTVRIAWQNIIFALAVKLATLLLGALGYAEMWMALVADVGVCLIAILNAMRAMHPGK